MIDVLLYDEHMEIIEVLKSRFLAHSYRHPEVDFALVKNFLRSNQKLLPSIRYMEETGGEPDVAIIEGELLICDFSKESPLLRRGLCYDKSSRESRKKNAPSSSVMEEAISHEVSLLDETLYTALQKIEEMDLKTSSWLATPSSIRDKGGAIFGEKRYGRVFIFHNGADSYYGVRGWRGYIALTSIL